VYNLTAGAWVQVGSDIDGEADWDKSGSAVSLSSDGSTVAIGARTNTGGGLSVGHVRVYKLTLGAWGQLGADIDGEADYDEFGYSVSLSLDGSTVAIGAPANDGGGLGNSGQVRVYGWTGTAWAQVGANINGEAAGDRSGASVELSSDGSIVAIGARNNGPAFAYRGHVRVYELTSGAWGKVGADIDGEADDDQSGFSVSLSSDGSTVAISAPYNDGTGSNAGHARVYDLTAGAWTQVGSDINGEAAGDYSGSSVSLSSDGSRVAIGAYSNGGNAGHVRVYDLTAGAWTQVGSDINGESGGDYSGVVSLSSSGSRVAIGAQTNDGAGAYGDDVGHVRVYELSSGGGGGGGGGGGSGITSEPRNLKVSKSGWKLAWKAPKSLNGGTITDYVIQYRAARTTLWSTFTDGTSTSRTATVTGLTKNVTYKFQVSARTSGGDSPFSKAK